MNRNEILLNLLLLVIIGSLAYLVLESGQDEEHMVGSSNVAVRPKDKADKSETDYNPAAAQAKYPNFGKKAIYQALLTPTPTPPPPTPPPTKTPDISQALGAWKLLSVMDGEATIENKATKDPEQSMIQMKVNDTRQVTVGNETKIVTLKRADENSDNPSATFSMEGTTDEKTLKMFDDAAAAGGAPAGAPAAPGPAAGK